MKEHVMKSTANEGQKSLQPVIGGKDRYIVPPSGALVKEVLG